MKKKDLNVCVLIKDRELPYSETFIKAHVKNLSAKTLSYYELPIEGPPSLSESEGLIKRIASDSISSLKNIIKNSRVKRFIAKNRVDVFLAEYGMAGARAVPFCKKNNIPLVVHFHGYDAYRKDILEMYKEQYAELFEVAKAIVVVSKDMQRQIIDLGAPASKVFYNVYGVDTTQFRKADVKTSGKQLIAVGRFVDKKAPYLTILAFQLALEQIPDAKLLMVGSGNLFEICSRIVIALKLEKNIILYNSLSHAQVAELMQSSRAFVQHSLVPQSGDSEGTPNTILEAQASGLPVISTMHAGIKDVVIHGTTGYLVEEGDVIGMAHYMVQVLKDPDLSCKLGEAGYKNVLENYTMKQSISKLRSIIEENL